MFDLKKTCAKCPFRQSQAASFALNEERLEEIRNAPAFQCHATVDYSGETREERAGNKPQQCAGLMAVLHAQNTPNNIMQVAQRLINHNPGAIDTQDTFSSWTDVVNAHAHKDIPA